MSDAMAHVRFIDALHIATMRAASDIHLVPDSAPAIRVDGKLEYVHGAPLTSHQVAAIALELLSAEAMVQIESGKDVSSTWAGVEEAATLRVHGYRANNGIVLALRLLSRDIPPLESLHLPPSVATLASRRRGLVLFAGPTGSGKTTSLAALIDRINTTTASRIITIEDPVEYRHASKKAAIVQREVGRDACSFASAIVGSLRADPDVLVIGEMRDRETMSSALTAAETGHLVFSTLHTSDAPGTVDRIVDAFAGTEQAQIRSQLAAVLSAVVCQRLVPRAHGTGRRAVVEVLLATDAVRAIIRDGRTHQLRNAMLTSRQVGMQTLDGHLSELVSRGEVAPEVAIA